MSSPVDEGICVFPGRLSSQGGCGYISVQPDASTQSWFTSHLQHSRLRLSVSLQGWVTPVSLVVSCLPFKLEETRWQGPRSRGWRGWQTQNCALCSSPSRWLKVWSQTSHLTIIILNYSIYKRRLSETRGNIKLQRENYEPTSMRRSIWAMFSKVSKKLCLQLLFCFDVSISGLEKDLEFTGL